MRLETRLKLRPKMTAFLATTADVEPTHLLAWRSSSSGRLFSQPQTLSSTSAIFSVTPKLSRREVFFPSSRQNYIGSAVLAGPNLFGLLRLGIGPRV